MIDKFGVSGELVIEIDNVSGKIACKWDQEWKRARIDMDIAQIFEYRMMIELSGHLEIELQKYDFEEHTDDDEQHMDQDEENLNKDLSPLYIGLNLANLRFRYWIF